jgi:hypothetical protein
MIPAARTERARVRCASSDSRTALTGSRATSVRRHRRAAWRPSTPGSWRLQRRVQTLEATVQEFQAASQDAGEIAADVEALNDSMQALEQRIEALEQQQP